MIDYQALARELYFSIRVRNSEFTAPILDGRNIAIIKAALHAVADQQREQDAQIAESLQIPGHSVAGPQIAAIAEAIRFVR